MLIYNNLDYYLNVAEGDLKKKEEIISAIIAKIIISDLLVEGLTQDILDYSRPFIRVEFSKP